MSERPRLPKVEEFRLSPEAAKGFADFKRAVVAAGETMAHRANEVMAELAASIERNRAGSASGATKVLPRGCISDPAERANR